MIFKNDFFWWNNIWIKYKKKIFFFEIIFWWYFGSLIIDIFYCIWVCFLLGNWIFVFFKLWLFKKENNVDDKNKFFLCECIFFDWLFVFKRLMVFVSGLDWK